MDLSMNIFMILCSKEIENNVVGVIEWVTKVEDGSGIGSRGRVVEGGGYGDRWVVMYATFRDKDPETAIEANIDVNLRGIYPTEEVQKMAELARRCLSEDPDYRPEMREVVTMLAQILMSSIE
ncbi:receptor-like serine/threonine-protein kinase NCRK [Actinidia eriantha]|uniref:receptor-like serine/threonine-protein kinase NCRK n=1 Tax=Actinidia eriantha TaxID=165200 RepID=UPI0025897223|nr:receptor-like serine/threonine-protein kinase NCRK [Actinidia eriantha]